MPDLRLLIDHLPELAWTARADGHIDFYNRRWYEYTGTTFEQLQGWGWKAVHDPAMLPEVEATWRRSLETGEPFEMEFPLRRHDGVFRWFLTRIRPLHDEAGTITRWFGTNADVHDRRLAETALSEALAHAEEQRQLLDRIVEQSGEGIIMADEAGVLRVFNPAAERQHGATKAELAAPEWAEAYGLLTLDGTKLPLEATPLFRAVHGEPSDGVRWIVQRPDGARRVLTGTARPLTKADGKPGGAVLVTRDETERLALDDERERLLEALARSNADLDQFAYVASHDLKAPLRGIVNLSQWIEEDLGEALSGEAREHMTLLRGRVSRLEGLIDGILGYSRAGRSNAPAVTLDVGVVAREVVELLAPPPHVRFVLPEPGVTLVAERAPFEQVLLNLVGNAVKHGRTGDAVVRVEAEDAGAFVRVRVRDDGPGIAPAFHERIWQIFQTLEARDDVEGTGIGLSVVKKIVESRGGNVAVESALGAGATFSVEWPKRRRGDAG